MNLTDETTSMRRVVILGATSGIALEVERQLARQGCELFLVARSPQRLSELQVDLCVRGARQVFTYAADLASIQQHASIFEVARRAFPDFDTVLLAYGSMHNQKESETEKSVDVLLNKLQVNFVSASAILILFAADFGTLANGMSGGGLRRRRRSRTTLELVYGSAKGGLSLFLQGLERSYMPREYRLLPSSQGLCRLDDRSRAKRGRFC